MKKIWFLWSALIVIAFTSCQPTDVDVTINYVPCTFTPSSVIASVDDTPLTKVATNPRVIKYQIDEVFPNAKLFETGTVIENENLVVELAVNAQYRIRFIYADSITNNIVTVHNADVYEFDQVYNITNPISENITLTRSVGLFTAKIGSIPPSTYARMTLTNNNQYDWLSRTIQPNTVSTMDNMMLYNEFISCYVLGNTGTNKPVTVQIGVYNNSTNKLIKQSVYNYNIPKNTKRTVTYNISYSSYGVAIDTNWETTELTESQQIGK